MQCFFHPSAQFPFNTSVVEGYNTRQVRRNGEQGLVPCLTHAARIDKHEGRLICFYNRDHFIRELYAEMSRPRVFFYLFGDDGFYAEFFLYFCFDDRSFFAQRAEQNSLCFFQVSDRCRDAPDLGKVILNVEC